VATLEDVRRIALRLPEVTEYIEGHGGAPAWRTKRGMLAWVRGPRKSDLKQLAALGRSWPDGTVVAIRVDGDDSKQTLLTVHAEALFTVPHFDGYPAVLAILEKLDVDLLEDLLLAAWTTRVSRTAAKKYLGA